jgi:hypothetical protein
MGQDKGRPYRRVTCHRQLNGRRKNANVVIMSWVVCWKYETRFREVEFLGERLHRISGKVLRICKNGERIAAKGAISKDINQTILKLSHSISLITGRIVFVVFHCFVDCCRGSSVIGMLVSRQEMFLLS